MQPTKNIPCSSSTFYMLKVCSMVQVSNLKTVYKCSLAQRQKCKCQYAPKIAPSWTISMKELPLCWKFTCFSFQVKELRYYPLPCGAFASIWDDPPSTDGGSCWMMRSNFPWRMVKLVRPTQKKWWPVGHNQGRKSHRISHEWQAGKPTIRMKMYLLFKNGWIFQCHAPKKPNTSNTWRIIPWLVSG